MVHAERARNTCTPIWPSPPTPITMTTPARLDVVDGEHDAANAQRVRWYILRSGLIAFGVWNIANSIPPWPSGVRSIATSCRTSSIPITRSTQLPRSALALQLHPELDEERNDGVKVLDNDEDVVHPVDRHAGSPWALLGHGPHPHRAEAARPISTTLARVYRGNFLTQHRSSNVLRIDGPRFGFRVG
jgi:hypothetical protein